VDADALERVGGSPTVRSLIERLATAIFWIAAGAMHFVVPLGYEAIMPRRITRWRRELVILSGVAEIAGGLAVFPARTRRAARWWLLGTLAAVYPANINLAINAKDFPFIPPAWRPALWVRLPVQFLFGWLTWRATRRSASTRSEPRQSRTTKGY
jgi:uncharacterized membrane protein